MIYTVVLASSPPQPQMPGTKRSMYGPGLCVYIRVAVRVRGAPWRVDAHSRRVGAALASFERVGVHILLSTADLRHLTASMKNVFRRSSNSQLVRVRVENEKKGA